MNNALIFRILLTTLFVIVVGTRKYFERQATKVAEEGLMQDKDSRPLIAGESLLLTISNLSMIAYLITPSWMVWSSLTISEWLGWLGAMLGVTATAILIWTHRTLGKNFFGGMKLRQGHQLITNGPYRWIRHPMYTVFIILGLSWFLLSGNWMITGFWLAGTVLSILTRLEEEEKLMRQEFGETYRIYVQQTGRFIPRIRSKVP